MSDLNIQVAENGFVVNDHEPMRGTVCKQWAFETAESLAKFIKNWGEDIHKPIEALPVLEKGKALVITGGKGAGKSTLARKIAHNTGDYISTTFNEMKEGAFALGRVLGDKPDAVIIEDDTNEFSDAFDFMKKLIASDTLMVDRKGMVPENVKTPHFIICTGAIDPLKLGISERRFTVLPL